MSIYHEEAIGAPHSEGHAEEMARNHGIVTATYWRLPDGARRPREALAML